MNRIVAIVTVASFFVGCQTTLAPKYPSPEQLAQTARAATVGIATFCSNGGVQFGSGTITRHDTVITAAHVVQCDGAEVKLVVVEYLDANDQLVQVAATGTNQLRRDGEAIDAARLTVPALTFTRRAVESAASGAPALGSTVCLSAYIPNRLWACTAVEDVEKGEVQVAQPVYPGNSGGGAYNEAGELIAVVVQSSPCHDQTGAYAICGGVVLLLAGSTD
jgi:V8-like Glu-specific endopeptidase